MLLGSSRVFGARIPRMNRKDAADSLEKIGFRFMAGSALFVPDRLAEKQFRIFSPEISSEDIERRKEELEKILEKRRIKINLDKLEEDIKQYNLINIKLKQSKKEKIDINTNLKELNKSGSTDTTILRNRLASLQVVIKEYREKLLVYEDKSIPEYLNLPNTSPHTPLTDRILFESDPVNLDLKNTTRTPLTHEQIIEEQNLAEFSNVSHTAVYLQDKLSKLELNLSRQFQDKLLDQGFEMFSNPDFSKSVIVEGCGTDLSGSDLFHLKPMQDFGDKESCNAMYLVGGASVEPFAAYFARNLLLTPSVLPLNLFSIGRKYNPVHQLNTRSLLEQQQCTAVQFFSVSQSEENMNLELENMKELLMDLLVGFGQLRILENSGEGLQRREGRRFSFQLLLPVSHQYIEIGNISVENDYYSKRLMIKQKVGDSFRNVWTLSGTVANITKLLTILLETDSHLINEKN